MSFTAESVTDRALESQSVGKTPTCDIASIAFHAGFDGASVAA